VHIYGTIKQSHEQQKVIFIVFAIYLAMDWNFDVKVRTRISLTLLLIHTYSYFKRPYIVFKYYRVSAVSILSTDRVVIAHITSLSG